MALDWPEPMTLRLRELWPTNYTASEIGKMLGVSKGAILGKVRRLKLPPRVEPEVLRNRAPRKPSSPSGDGKRSRGNIAAPPAYVPPPRKCQWPLGEPGKPGFRFCEEPSTPGKVYCAAHCAKAYARGER